jgi:hypothetical protein
MTGKEVVNFEGLKKLGIPYCRTTICERLEPVGLFPKSFKLRDTRNSPRVWWLKDVIEWLESRANLLTAP